MGHDNTSEVELDMIRKRHGFGFGRNIDYGSSIEKLPLANDASMLISDNRDADGIFNDYLIKSSEGSLESP